MPNLPPTLGGSKKKKRVGGSATIRPAGSRWQAMRLTILQRYPVCVYCLPVVSPSKIVDHIIALALGGTSQEGNLIGACRDCNSAKGKLEQAWQAAGWPVSSLTHAAPIEGSLAWYIKRAREAQ